MNSITLTISTGVEDTEIIDLGLYNPSIEGPITLAMLNTGFTNRDMTLASFNGTPAKTMSGYIAAALEDMNDPVGPAGYTMFNVADLLAAQNYLTTLKIACDTYPACTIKIETL